MNRLANPFASELLEVGAPGYAAAATERLLDAHPQIRAAFSPGAHLSWRDHLHLRLRELAAALAAGQPEMFQARVLWSWQSFTARGIDPLALTYSLQALRATLDEKLPPGASAEAVAAIDEALGALEGELPPSPSALDPAVPAQAVALDYLQTALEGDARTAMETVLEKGGDSRAIICDILLPAQVEIGRLWHLNQLSVAEEHLISTTTERTMAVAVERSERAPPNGRSVLAATMPADHHDLGLRAVTYLMELAGWRVYYLGADVPVDDLVTAVGYFGVDVAMLSASMSIQLRQLRAVIEGIRGHAGVDARILVGGSAFADAPDAWQSVGADAWAGSAEEALAAAERLAGRD